MNNGYFFEIKFPPSDIGPPYFTYLPIKSKKDLNFPIYLTLGNEHLEIFFHGENADKSFEYNHDLLLKLPLSTDTSSMYNLCFELSRLNNESDPEFDFTQIAKGKIITNGNYLHSFNKDLHSFRYYFDELTITNKNYLHILMLDFLFDFYNTELFHNHPLYIHTLNALSKNFIFDAIYKKAVLIYSRCFGIDKSSANLSQLTLRMNFDAEAKYSQTLMDKQFLMYVNKTGKWFKSVEEEMSVIYLDNVGNKSRKDYMNDVSKNIKTNSDVNNYIRERHNSLIDVVSKWFKSRYALCNFFKVLLFNNIKL